MAAIILLSVDSPPWRPVTPAPHSLEHLLPFAALGVAMALAFPWRWPVQAIALVLFAAAIEQRNCLLLGATPV